MKTVVSNQLVVDYSRVNLGDRFAPDSWSVEVDVQEDNTAILWGFGRERDAVLAAKFLSSLDVDWTLPSKQMWRQCAEAGYPDRDALMKGACEHLAW